MLVFWNNYSYDFINSDKYENLANELNKVNKASCVIYLLNCLTYLNKYKELLPTKCTYILCQSNENKLDFENYIIYNADEIMDELSWLYVSEIILELQLTGKECDLIKRIISSPNCKTHLRKILLKPYKLENVIEILDLLSECQNIETIELEYRYFPTISYPLKAVKEAKNKFKKKVGVIRKLCIKLCS